MTFQTIAAGLLASVIAGCGWSTLHRDEFFDGDHANRAQRMEGYPLERQWRIYLYAMQAVHPPDMSLAVAIAKQGKVAGDFVLQQLAVSREDLDYLNGLFIFEVMRWRGGFNICADRESFAQLAAVGYRVKRKSASELFWSRLHELCPADELH